jgi:hypothetical protein
LDTSSFAWGIKDLSLSDTSLLGTVFALISIPCTVAFGLVLKKFWGSFSGVTGLIAAYQIWANFG